MTKLYARSVLKLAEIADIPALCISKAVLKYQHIAKLAEREQNW
jgi:hypothetical protein